jgi:hypothetical protein
MRFGTGSMITSCSSWSGFQPAHSSLRGSAVDCALALASLGGLRVGACFVAATSGDYFSRLANDAASCAHQAVAYRQHPVRLAMAEKMAINRYNWYSIYQ